MINKNYLSAAGILHDIGKILYRSNLPEYSSGDHSYLGWEYLKNFDEYNQLEIKESVLFHHFKNLKNAKISNDSAAYIVYFADNIASGVDRRDIDSEDKSKFQFVKTAPLQSIFNIVSGNPNDNMSSYRFSTDGKTQYPTYDLVSYSSSNYNELVIKMNQVLGKIGELDTNHINSLVQILEQLWSNIPSSTNIKQLMDISLFDHCKITGALSSCIYDYLNEKDIDDYKQCFTKKYEKYYDEDMFMLFSMDMSGIQDFIYNISGCKALKSLRSRSFYLEILLEYLSDELLSRLSLTRTNLLYIGGGRATFLLPNTEFVKESIKKFANQVRRWFIDNFTTDLSIAYGMVECSGNTLMNKNGEYSNVWKELSRKISRMKSKKYRHSEIIKLNNRSLMHNRECKECLRSDIELNDERLCPICENIINISAQLVNKDYFIISETATSGLILPFNRRLICANRSQAEDSIKKNVSVFTYSKNNPTIGNTIATNIWMGDYDYSRLNGDSEQGIASYTNRDIGVRRLGILRADVDNLGATFISGIAPKYQSISRTTTLSRLLSKFFKYEINQLLNGYRATVVYAGGDDLFIIGAWDDIIDISLQIRRKFTEFTLNRLTLSAGIGLYSAKYPVSRMAYEVGDLEDLAKSGTKNQLVLWYPNNLYTWNDFEKNVEASKLPFLNTIYKTTASISFMYNLLRFLTNVRENDGINLARFAYTLARNELNQEQIHQLYDWAVSTKDRQELITAMEILIYSNREEV